jgi:hypothetical protein
VLLRKVDLHVKLQTIVSKVDVAAAELAQALSGFHVRQIVGDVREPGATGTQLVNERERLFDGLVHGMRGVAESVKDEIVKIFQQSCGGCGQGTEIGQVRGAFETEAKDFEIAMEQRNGNDGHAEQFERTVDDVEVDARHGAKRRRFIENISKGAAQHLESFLRAVNGDSPFLPNIERSNIIEPENVIGMTVG